MLYLYIDCCLDPNNSLEEERAAKEIAGVIGYRAERAVSVSVVVCEREAVSGAE